MNVVCMCEYVHIYMCVCVCVHIYIHTYANILICCLCVIEVTLKLYIYIYNLYIQLTSHNAAIIISIDFYKAKTANQDVFICIPEELILKIYKNVLHLVSWLNLINDMLCF